MAKSPENRKEGMKDQKKVMRLNREGKGWG